MNSKKPVIDHKSWPMFPLDAEIHTEPLRVCKSLLPYLPFEKQKNISIFIKFYELMSVIDHYSGEDTAQQPTTNFRQDKALQRDLLESVKGSLDPNNAFLIDILFKFGDVQKILSAVQSGTPYTEMTNTEPPKALETIPAKTNPGPSNDFMENISPMLDDNQKNMLKMLSTIMK